DNATIEAVFEDLTEAYLARDVAAIFDKMTTQTSVAGARFMELVMRRFNDDRNKLMARRMEPFLRAGGAFVAIGALHLPGDTGLVSLLRARGYRVTRAY
ncbi:MAG: TraB/GumN family protein, partial [Kiloniellaceae bacterium]